MAIKPRVLFLCTENSCRTQMAEAFLRALTGDEFELVSAGGEAGRLDPEAVSAMREVGIDISAASAKMVDPYLRQRFHYALRSGEGAVMPGVSRRDLAAEVASRKPGCLGGDRSRPWLRGAPGPRRDTSSHS